MARSRHTEDPTTPPDHELTAYERLAASRNGAQRCRFVDYYVEDPSSATAAAKAAGYKSRDMKQRAHELMSDPLVAAAIAQKMNERKHRTMITQDRVLNELAVIGFSDVGHYDTRYGIHRPQGGSSRASFEGGFPFQGHGKDQG